MNGIDDIELNWDQVEAAAAAGDGHDRRQRALAAQQHGNTQHMPSEQVQAMLQQPGGVLASAIEHGKPANDYDPSFIPLVHITSFPYGSGGPPKGMSTKAWAKLCFRRWPRPVLGSDAYLALDVFNVIQRHEVQCCNMLSDARTTETV